jgi:light-regulated signal transduction histidine kinase (bacteriophytochrome)
MNDDKDITRTLISSDFIYANIYALFPDSIFLDKDFKIVGMSNNIALALGYNNQVLSGKPLSAIQVEGNLEQSIRDFLRSGYFNNQPLKFITSDRQTLNYSVSGFYLGLLTDCNGYIILRCVNKEEVEIIEHKLRHATTHIDNFVYRAAHDLRGPLATMLGLINLLKIRKDDSEVDRFLDMIDMHGKKLDERLHQVVYLSKIDEELLSPTFTLDFSKLETELRKLIERNAFIDFLELNLVSKKSTVVGYNEVHIQSIVFNIFQYILSLPTCGTHSSIDVAAQESSTGLTISLKAKGFVTDPEIQDKMRETDSERYSQLLQHAKFINLFAAQKVALQSKAFISLDHLTADHEQITVWIPKALAKNT